MSEAFLPPVVAVLRSNISQFRAGMKEARGEMALVEGSSAKMSAGISKAGKGSALALAGVAAYSVHLAGNFQQATNVLVTAAGETENGLKVVRDGIKSVAMQTGVSFSNLEQGSYVLEKAGYRGANAVEMLRVASQGAREENADLGTVINAMTSVMASYHLKTADSVNVMNALKTGAGEAKTTMEDYAGALSTVLPIASAAHISFADIAGAFATLTQHGTTAQESTQELAATIRALQAPNHVQQVAMQQLGLSVNDVSQNIGKRGLTGTLDLLYQAIMQHMGPAGTVLTSAFNQSKTAARDADIMIGNMPAKLQGLAKAFRDGKITQAEWRKELKGLPVDQANLLRQFAALENNARGFSDQIKSGSPAAQTFTAALKGVTGGAIGLNTALQLTGENMAGTKTRVEAVQKSFDDSGKDVEGWKTTMGNVNTTLGQAKNALELVAMDLGNVLIPAVRTASTFIAEHKTLVEALAVVFGVVLVAATVAWVGKLAWAATESAMSLGRIAGKVFTTQMSWLGYSRTQATSTAQGSAAVARGAAAETAALTRVSARILTLEEQFWGLAAAEARSSAAGSAAIVRNAATAEAAMIAEGNTAVVTAGRVSTAMAGMMAMAGYAFEQVHNYSKDKPLLDKFAAKYGDPNAKKPGMSQSALDAMMTPYLTAAQRKAAEAAVAAATSGKAVSPSVAALLKQLSPNVSGGGYGSFGSGSGSSSSHKKTDPLKARRDALARVALQEMQLAYRESVDMKAAKAGLLSVARAQVDKNAALMILRHAKALEESTRGTKLHLQAVREVIRAEKELTVASKLLADARKGKAKNASHPHVVHIEAPKVGSSDPCALGNIKSLLALTNPGGAAGMAMLQAEFSIDGQKVFSALQPHALQYQNRNGISGIVQ